MWHASQSAKYLEDAKDCVRQLRARGDNLAHVEYAYVAAALAILDGHFKKRASGAPNPTAAAAAMGKKTKHPKRVTEWIERISVLQTVLADEQLCCEEAVDEVMGILANGVNVLDDSEWREVVDSLDARDIVDPSEVGQPDSPSYGLGDPAAELMDLGEELVYRVASHVASSAPMPAAAPAFSGTALTRPVRRNKFSRVQDESLGAIGGVRELKLEGTFTVVYVPPDHAQPIIVKTCMHVLLHLQRTNQHPIEDGVALGLGGRSGGPVFRWLGQPARVLWVSFPPEGYFRQFPERIALLQPWQNDPNIIVDPRGLDLAILELPRSAGDALPPLRALPCVSLEDAALFIGKRVWLLGYGQSGGICEERPTLTDGTLSRIRDAGQNTDLLQVTNIMACGHSGDDAVIEYAPKLFARIGGAFRSVTGSLGDLMCVPSLRSFHWPSRCVCGVLCARLYTSATLAYTKSCIRSCRFSGRSNSSRRQW